MKKMLTGVGILFAALPAFAATPVNLSHQPVSYLTHLAKISSGITMSEVSRATDFNQTLHVRMKEMYQGYPVWGGDAVLHTPVSPTAASFMNGLIYQGINQDLANTPKQVFDARQMEKAKSHAIMLYQQKKGEQTGLSDSQSQLIVYIDENNKAHWAYHISFLVSGVSNAIPQKPNYIMDAIKLDVYEEWNDIKTLDNVEAGGFGGNHKTGQKIFDGLDGHQTKLDVQRDASTGICIMKNDEVVVRDARNKKNPVSFDCKAIDPEHNNIYWNGSFDAVGTTWSPSNDALFGAKVTSGMFKNWYNMPMVGKNGKQMFLPMTVHESMTNAYWDGSQVVFGNSRGSKVFNPFTQLDTVAHEIGHGFTEHHANLQYSRHSGGINEAFSDMAGIAAEYYAFGKTEFLVGNGDVKAEGKALRYMDKPSKDCEGGQPGNGCSIDHIDEYYSGLDVHYSSGIFNRVYYNLANTPDWNAKKAFDVMVQANAHYWTSRTTFADAACGVVKAAKDYKYDLNAIESAFAVVGIETASCK